jgi:tetratricopeptide (TPR) repeat protein
MSRTHVTVACSLGLIAFSFPLPPLCLAQDAAAPAVHAQQLPSSYWAPAPVDVRIEPGDVVHFGSTGGSALGKSVIVKSGRSDRNGLQHYDAIHNSTSQSVPSIGPAVQPGMIVLGESAETINKDDRRSRFYSRGSAFDRPTVVIDGPGYAYGGYGPLYGYSLFAPGYVYDDVRGLYDAAEEIGRRKTFQRGALKMYRFRVGAAHAEETQRDLAEGREPLETPEEVEAYENAAPDPYAAGYSTGQAFAQLWLDRQTNLYRTARKSLRKGSILLHTGRYLEAADAFGLAANVDQGDPAARLLAGHAYFAIGKFQQAFRYIQLAFDLQPKLVFLDYDIRDDYGDRDEFAKHLAALEAQIEKNPRDYQLLALYGYVLRYSGDREKALAVFEQAYKVEPRARFVRRFLHIEPAYDE